MQLIATILEETQDGAIAAIRALPSDVDGVELRFEALRGESDLGALRAASSVPMIFTSRSTPEKRVAFDAALLERALAAGFDLVDVEIDGDIDAKFVNANADRVVLSLHDYQGMPDLAAVIALMAAHRTAHAKIAVTPASFRDNQKLLETLVRFRGNFAGSRLTVIGMGDRGLYSRILAPFFGSELAFVTPDDRAAAPGQLSIDRAQAIYGSRAERAGLAGIDRNRAIFAVVGSLARQSKSPSIHNPIFRRRGALAAYSIASTDSFDEIAGPFAAGGPFVPVGLSITAPFKEAAFRFADQLGASIGANAGEARSINTLVRTATPATGNRQPATFLADNTDVDAFETALGRLCGRDRKSVALVGAGGTARAALVALRRAGMDVTVFNRTESHGAEIAAEFGARFQPLDKLERFDGEVLVNTLPGAVALGIPPATFRAGRAYIDVDYSGGRAAIIEAARAAGMTVVDGRELLDAQAVRQSELFFRALPAESGPSRLQKAEVR